MGEGQDKHTPPSDNKESSEVNPPLPAIPVKYTEISQPPSTIGKQPATKTDVTRPKFPHTETDGEKKGDAKVEKEADLTIYK